MEVSQTISLLLEAAEQGHFQPEDIIRWADTTIEATDNPPYWIIELSLSNEPHLVDFTRKLREQPHTQLSVRQRIQVSLLAWRIGKANLRVTLGRLFRISILERLNYLNAPRGELDELLHDALSEWDMLDDLEVIPADLERKCRSIFDRYLVDSEEIACALGWDNKSKT